MKIIYSLPALTTLLIFSCTTPKVESKNIPGAWFDAIKKNSDSTYSKPYYRTDFVTADYYFTKKDASLCQAMKDSAGLIRQIIITTKNVRTFFGQYYANGQLQATLPLDDFGQYHGTATYYYADGTEQSKGEYAHGLKQGTWKLFNDKGKLVTAEQYNTNGQLVKLIKY